jgi:hypothetical protein
MFSVSRIILRRTLSTLQRTTLIKSSILTPKQINPTRYNFCTKTTQDTSSESNSVVLGKLERKFQMMYTCKVCQTRNSQIISHLAYEKGKQTEI